jgi:NAD(P)-dependent dehydrogenase (short-subunit alcohol dehydrogenase family)
MEKTKKTLVIIGGSTGIGAATAILAAQKGYRIAIGYFQNKRKAIGVSDEIKSIGGVVKIFQIDVTDYESVINFFNMVISFFGHIDGLVNCAAFSGDREKFIDLKPEIITKTISTNLIGSFYTVQAGSKMMSTTQGGRGGSIVLLSSEAAKFGGNLLTAYAASKGGINSMLLGIAREIAKEGIRVNAVSPGLIAEKGNNILLNGSPTFDIINTIPLGRLGKSDEVASAVLWLISDETSYITGTILSIAGGR